MSMTVSNTGKRKSQWLDFRRAFQNIFSKTDTPSSDLGTFRLPYNGSDEEYLGLYFAKHPFLKEQADKGHKVFTCENGVVYYQPTLAGIFSEIRHSAPPYGQGVDKIFIDQGFKPELPDEHPENQRVANKHLKYQMKLLSAAKANPMKASNAASQLNF